MCQLSINMLNDLYGPSFVIGLEAVLAWAPLFVLIVLGGIGWTIWIRYKREQFIESIKWSLLEIRIPKEVYKSPAAMELVLIKALHQTGGVGTWYARYWQGKVLLWSSLEIVSIEGKIYFFIRTPVQFKPLVESQIYAQYPQAEINEIDGDYAYYFPPYEKDGSWSLFGSEFVLTKPDPFPIKTYIDYGLDRNATSLEAEQQIDPITTMLEYLGSLKKGEQMWIQILVRAHQAKRYAKAGHYFEKRKLEDIAEEQISEIFKKAKFKAADKTSPSSTDLSKAQQQAIEAIERNMDKVQFDCGIRALYLAEKGSFSASNITGLMSLLKQYNSATLNGFKPSNATSFDFPWQDFNKIKETKLKKKIYNYYRLRSYFYEPAERTPFVLSSEELATLFHFPGRVSETPSFKRIESKKSEPPVNLPM